MTSMCHCPKKPNTELAMQNKNNSCSFLLPINSNRHDILRLANIRHVINRNASKENGHSAETLFYFVDDKLNQTHLARDGSI